MGFLFYPKLTHPSTCIGMQNTTIVWLSIDLMYKSEKQLTINGFTFLSQTQTSIDMHRHAEYHYCVTVYRSDVQPEKQSDHNFDTYGFQFFPGNHLRSSNSNYTDLKN